jgi:hypothetical protein
MSSDRRAPREDDAPPSFEHLRRLTDDTGLLEHALGRIPRRKEGYTADDNARALWTVTEWLKLGPDAVTAEDRSLLMRLADVYLSFLVWSQNENGWWHNNIGYNRLPEPEELSHDCQGRAFWSCADAWIRLDCPIRETARFVVERTMPTLGRIESHRGQAFTMAACAHLLEAADRQKIALASSIRSELEHHLERLEQLLNRAYNHFSTEQWQWFEPAMTYGNGVLPWAMLRTYRYTRHPESLNTGAASLACLLKIMTAPEGWLRPIGNEAWCSPSGVSRWDQQPLEMFKLALALEEAALAQETASAEAATRLVSATAAFGEMLTKRNALDRAPIDGETTYSRDQSRFRAIRDQCKSWYYGANDSQTSLVDPADGSCCDGLTRHGPNINCGAEATISYLMTEALCRKQATTDEARSSSAS